MPRNASGRILLHFQISNMSFPPNIIYKSHHLAKKSPPKAKKNNQFSTPRQIRSKISIPTPKVWGGMTLWRGAKIKGSDIFHKRGAKIKAMQIKVSENQMETKFKATMVYHEVFSYESTELS